MTDAGRQLALAAAPHPLARLNDNSFLALAQGLDDDGDGRFRAATCANSWACTNSPSAATKPCVCLRRDRLRGLAAHVLRHRQRAGSHRTRRAGGTRRSARAWRPMCRRRRRARTKPGSRFPDDDLELAYQPIVSVAGSELAQYQVLLRMRQPDGSLVSAAQAVPAAELAGRIVDLDRQVMERVLDLLSRYQMEGTVAAPVRFAIAAFAGARGRSPTGCCRRSPRAASKAPR